MTVLQVGVESINVLPTVALVTYREDRGMVVEVYNLPPAEEKASMRSQPSMVQAMQARVNIPQAQLLAISSPIQPKGAIASPPDLSPGPFIHEFRLLAALPSSLNHYLLTIRQMSLSSQPELDLVLVGTDQGSRRPTDTQITPNSPTTVHEQGEEYDPDATLDRIAQPSQVLDLQIGPLGKRAVAIRVSPRTNEREIWAYSIHGSDGSLMARKLALSSNQRQRGKMNSLDRATTDAEIQMLKSHACRVAFDEVRGCVLVAADCDKVVVFQY